MEETTKQEVIKVAAETIMPAPNESQVMTVNKKAVGAFTQIEMQRANREVEMAMLMAQNFPRDLNQVRMNVLDECQIPSVAEKCIYSIKRSSEKIEGGSIRLAELIERHYTNVDTLEIIHTISETETEKEIVIWDLEKRKRECRRFIVKHMRYSKEKGWYRVNAGNDIRQIVNSETSFYRRNALFKVIPLWLLQDALETCRRTIAKAMQNGETRAKMLGAFQKEFEINQESLEAYIGKRIQNFSNEDYAELRGVFNALESGEAKLADFFSSAAPLAAKPEPTKAKPAPKAKPADKEKEPPKAEEPPKVEPPKAEPPKAKPPGEIKKGIF